MNVKKKLKEIVEDTYSWVSDPKGSDDFNDDLNITDDELGDLKKPIKETFGITIRKRDIKWCIDINELTELIEKRLSEGKDDNSGEGEYDGGLIGDLERYKNELYTKADLEQGLKIIYEIVKEVGGAIALATAVGTVLKAISAGILAPIGLSITGAQITRLKLMAIQAYARSNASERKQIRAAVRYIRGGFNLRDHLIK
jgi:hypothetical protein